LESGQKVNENYGFSAKTAGPNVLLGPTDHIVMTEKPKYIRTTNRHFTLTVSDATYRRMKAEVIAWRDAPGKFYDLDKRNCIHFALGVLPRNARHQARRSRLFRRSRHQRDPQGAADDLRLRGRNLHRRPGPGRGAGTGAP